MWDMKILKKSVIAFQLLTMGNLVAQTVVVNEDFTYDDGTLVGESGGIGFTEAWSVTTTNASGVLSEVDGGTLATNPDGLPGGFIDNDSIAERSFIGINGDSLEINLDYALISDTEGQYSFQFILLDSAGSEVFTAGITNDSYEISFAGGQTVTQGVDASPFNDTLTLSLDLASSSLGVDSAVFSSLDTTLTSNTSFDFTSGGTIQVVASDLDQNQIALDNITIATVPEPSSFFLVSCAALIPIFRRNRRS